VTRLTLEDFFVLKHDSREPLGNSPGAADVAAVEYR
jgi:hypothetical protein